MVRCWTCFLVVFLSLCQTGWAGPSTTSSQHLTASGAILDCIPIGRSSVVVCSDTCGQEECNIGNLLGDAVLGMARRHGHCEAALLPANLFRASITPDEYGSLFLGQIRAAVADEPLIVAELTVTDLLRLIENGLAAKNTNNGHFLQMAGLRMAFDPARPPLRRVLSLTLSSGEDLVRDGLVTASRPIHVVLPQSLAEASGITYLSTLPSSTRAALVQFLSRRHVLGPWFTRDTAVTHDRRIRNLSMRDDGLSGRERSPLNGWYWQDGHYGTSLAVAQNNGRLEAGWFTYDHNGNPVVYRSTLGRLGTGFDGSLCLNDQVIGRMHLDFDISARSLVMKAALPDITIVLPMTRYTDTIHPGWTDRRDLNGWWHGAEGDFFLETRGGAIVGAWIPKEGSWLACSDLSSDGEGDIKNHRNLTWGKYANGQISGGEYRSPDVVEMSQGWFKIVGTEQLEISIADKPVMLQRDPYTLSFAVLPDTHLMAPELIRAYGPALRSYELWDSKFLAASDAIMSATVDRLIQDKTLAFVIIPGDLTKDGEAASHQRMLTHLSRLRDAGIATYVVPGNHDLLNPHSMLYRWNSTEPAQSLSPQEFATYYGAYGYEQALSRDTASLSYVAEPVDGIWLFAIDSCRYDENTGLDDPVIGGRIRAQTQQWLAKQATKGKERGKLLLAFMHHGLMEHFTGQSRPELAEDFVVEDWQQMATLLNNLGFEVVFTGHAHTMDVTSMDTNTGTIYDVETASPVTSAGLFRRASLDNAGRLILTTDGIEYINYDLGEKSFEQYAAIFLEESLHAIIPEMLAGFGLPQPKIVELAPKLLAAVTAHHHGDEPLFLGTLLDALKYANDSDSRIANIGMLLATLWRDLPPRDNNLVIQLHSYREKLTQESF